MGRATTLQQQTFLRLPDLAPAPAPVPNPPARLPAFFPICPKDYRSMAKIRELDIMAEWPASEPAAATFTVCVRIGGQKLQDTDLQC